jgi:hypothetical protein
MRFVFIRDLLSCPDGIIVMESRGFHNSRSDTGHEPLLTWHDILQVGIGGHDRYFEEEPMQNV